jgi:hypothetical protein
LGAGVVSSAGEMGAEVSLLCLGLGGDAAVSVVVSVESSVPGVGGEGGVAEVSSLLLVVADIVVGVSIPMPAGGSSILSVGMGMKLMHMHMSST